MSWDQNNVTSKNKTDNFSHPLTFVVGIILLSALVASISTQLFILMAIVLFFVALFSGVLLPYPSAVWIQKQHALLHQNPKTLSLYFRLRQSLTAHYITWTIIPKSFAFFFLGIIIRKTPQPVEREWQLMVLTQRMSLLKGFTLILFGQRLREGLTSRTVSPRHLLETLLLSGLPKKEIITIARFLRFYLQFFPSLHPEQIDYIHQITTLFKTLASPYGLAIFQQLEELLWLFENQARYTHHQTHHTVPDTPKASLNSLYNTLEITTSSPTNDEVQRAYKKVMIKYHPDRWASKQLSDSERRRLEEKVKTIQNAYATWKKYFRG